MKPNKIKQNTVLIADAVVCAVVVAASEVVAASVVVSVGNSFSKSPNSVMKVLSAIDVSG